MHRSRVILTRAAKTIAEASPTTTTTTTKEASFKATLPASATTTASAVAASSSEPPRHDNPTSALSDNSPVSNSNSNSTTTPNTTTASSNTTTSSSSSSWPYTIPLYHHDQPALFPPLRPGTLSYVAHHISSSVSAAYSLCTSQESRDRFMYLTNPTTIHDDDDDRDTDASFARQTEGAIIVNTNVLGQSDVGFFKSLTLYQDLCHPLFLDECNSKNKDSDDYNYSNNSSSYTNHIHKINVKEFLMGCGWALEQFHKTKEEVLIKWLYLDLMEKMNKNETTIEDRNAKRENDLALSSSPSRSSASRFISDFASTAFHDPTSLEYDFIKMTTPEIFLDLQMDGTMRLVLLQGEEGRMPTATTTTITKLSKMEDIRVMNVALLSARVQEIYPPPSPPPPSSLSSASLSLDGKITKKNIKDDSDSAYAPLEDDSLMPQQRTTDDAKAQVVTQLEVVYELQQSSTIKEDVSEKDEKNNEKTMTSTRTKTSVMVGKFEACLEGDSNHGRQGDGTDKEDGSPALRWRLASYRPALEFYNTF